MVERVKRRFGLRPQRLAGDTAYGAVKLLKWLVDHKIAPHIPVWDNSARRDGTFRAVAVEVIPPHGRGKLVARTRNGYYAPSEKTSVSGN